jgi:citrate lyase subunit beta / citryl-CoA lyase
MRIRRSTLLVPANVDRMVAKARDLAADVVMLDLEDAVPATDADKDKARATMSAALAAGGFRAREVAVRINGPRAKWFEADVAATSAAGVTTISLPHTYGAEDVARAEAALAVASPENPPEILLAVETPATLLELTEIARHARHVTALYVAPIDFTLAIGSTALLFGDGAMADSGQLTWLRHQLLTVARARGWNAVDAPIVADPRDAEAVRQAMAASRAAGFDGASALHPDHVAIANEVFAPSPQELAWAADTIARFETLRDGRNADTSGGKLVMVQHYEFAQSLQALAKRIGAG